MKDGVFRIAQFGSFDVESMGDTLFPHALSHGLSKHVACRVTLFSMRGCENSYNNNGVVHALDAFPLCHAEEHFDLVVLGGGEFLHFKPIRFTVDGVEKPYGAGYLWKKPIEMAKAAGVPVVLNCVGVSYDMTPSEQAELKAYLENALCVSVRDVYSLARLRAAGVEHAISVADNLWYMNEMFPKAALAETRQVLEGRTGKDFSTPYILVQYGTTKNAPALAEQLLAFQRETGLRVLLMPVNYCHEDREGMRLLAEAGEGAFEAVDDYFQPSEMIAVISGASAFVGTSLHGNLTAASYGVPFVGIDMYPSFVSKMDGIFAMIGCEEYLVPTERAVKSALSARLADGGREAFVLEKIRACQAALDRHFEKITHRLKGDA